MTSETKAILTIGAIGGILVVLRIAASWYLKEPLRRWINTAKEKLDLPTDKRRKR